MTIAVAKSSSSVAGHPAHMSLEPIFETARSERMTLQQAAANLARICSEKQEARSQLAACQLRRDNALAILTRQGRSHSFARGG
jgi:hypothetical protein